MTDDNYVIPPPASLQVDTRTDPPKPVLYDASGRPLYKPVEPIGFRSVPPRNVR